MKWNFRKIKATDSDQLLKWRNTEAIFRFLFNPFPVDANVHKTWIKKALANQHVLFLIAKYGTNEIGTVRFDFNKEFTVAEVGLYLAKDWQGKGLGSQMLALAEKKCLSLNPTIKTFNAKVLIENKASMRLFEKNEYQKSYVTLNKNIK